MKKEDKNYNILLSFLEYYKANLVRYEYYQKLFGNYVIEIEFKGKNYTFIADRGEIYLDSVLLCDSSYHKAGERDVFAKLLDMVKQELFDMRG